MKAGILYDDRDIRVGDAPNPIVGPGDVLVAPAYTGICGTDLHIYRGEFHGRVTYPAIPGHEFGGLVQEVGKEVRGFRRGDRVVVDPVISCHSCPACRTGHLNACRTLKLLPSGLRRVSIIMWRVRSAKSPATHEVVQRLMVPAGSLVSRIGSICV